MRPRYFSRKDINLNKCPTCEALNPTAVTELLPTHCPSCGMPYPSTYRSMKVNPANGHYLRGKQLKGPLAKHRNRPPPIDPEGYLQP